MHAFRCAAPLRQEYAEARPRHGIGAPRSRPRESLRSRWRTPCRPAAGRLPARDGNLGRRSIDHWRRGDLALAHIELAFARLPPLATEEDAFRLFLAGALLDAGTAPDELHRHLSPSPYMASLRKFDPAQPRIPAGSGAESGRWLSVDYDHGADGASPESAFAGGAAARTVLADATPAAVEALALFASRFAVPTAVLGALFIPTPNSGGVKEGTLPSAADIRYRRDGPMGLLRLARTLPGGTEAAVVAENRRGVYYAGDTAIGRDLGGQLYLDLDAVTVALAPRERPRRQATDSRPQLCPRPEIDVFGSSKPHVLDYEDDVHRRVNPIAPLPRGFAVRIQDPETGQWQYPDDCFRYAGDLVDGDMRAGDFADAKGKGYAFLLSLPIRQQVLDKLVNVTTRHLRAARARGAGLKVYFAEREAADTVREEFEENGLGDVVVGVLPSSR